MDNKQIQEIYHWYRNYEGSCTISTKDNDTVIGSIYKKDNADLVIEAFNVKAESGKGPKELWEENKTLATHLDAALIDFEYVKNENKALVERVKELEGIISETYIWIRGNVPSDLIQPFTYEKLQKIAAK